MPLISNVELNLMKTYLEEFPEHGESVSSLWCQRFNPTSTPRWEKLVMETPLYFKEKVKVWWVKMSVGMDFDPITGNPEYRLETYIVDSGTYTTHVSKESSSNKQYVCTPEYMSKCSVFFNVDLWAYEIVPPRAKLIGADRSVITGELETATFNVAFGTVL